MRARNWIVVAALIGFLSGCGDKKGSTGGVAAPPPVDGTKAAPTGGGTAATTAEVGKFPQAKATASIKGKVVWDGAIPKTKNLLIQGDDFCTAAHKTKVPNEKWIVSADKTVPNVFVYVKKGADQWQYDTPAKPVQVDQMGCMYAPHVFGIMVGQKLEITSSDNTKHNVHGVLRKSPEFNHEQTKGTKITKTFQKSERAYLKCDIHSWMKTHMHIMKHPFFAVTGADGTFDLGKLPPGEYEVAVWHENKKFKAKQKSQTIKVGDGEMKELTFTFSK